MIQPKATTPNIHKSLRFIFSMAQVFGYFPVQGILKDKPSDIGFTWLSLRVLSTILTGLSGVLCIVGHIYHMGFLDGYEQHQLTGIVFYSSGTLSCICFIALARSWREIVTKWMQLDASLSSYGWPASLDKTLKTISIIFLTLEGAEHFSLQANKLIVAVNCRKTFSKGFEHFTVQMSYPMLFDVIPYAAWIGIVLQCMNTRMAFSWTFIDLFIILMSSALAARFSQINERITRMRDMKVNSSKTWGVLCDDYNRLCKFTEYLDDKISWLVLVSFANNFYFLIFQVYASLTLVLATPLEAVYYFVSLGLLILRVASICLYASKVHRESKLPLDLLASTPHEGYNKEIVRFIDSVKYQKVGITGKKIFFITKSLILHIAEGVIAYELVVIQFNKKLPKKEKPSQYSAC